MGCRELVMSCFVSGWWLLRCLFYSWMNCTSALCTFCYISPQSKKGWQNLKEQQTWREANIFSILKELQAFAFSKNLYFWKAIHHWNSYYVKPWPTLLSEARVQCRISIALLTGKWEQNGGLSQAWPLCGLDFGNRKGGKDKINPLSRGILEFYIALPTHERETTDDITAHLADN